MVSEWNGVRLPVPMLKLSSIFVLTATLSTAAFGQVIDPYYAPSYSISDLGSVSGLPTSYGGLVFKYDDPNTLLIGARANVATGAIYSIGVTRDAITNSVTGFAGQATFYASAPYIDGGLTYGPNNVLFYTGYPNNTIGQIEAGSSAPDKIISLTGLGITSSVGALQFVPAGYAGAGDLIIASYSASSYYRTSLIADGNGTFNLGPVSGIAQLSGGPEGIIFADNLSPLFTTDSMIVAEYSLGRVSTYELDANGNPILASRRAFISGLSGAEGAVIDPLTGDFLFSTFGGVNHLLRVDGLAAPVVIPNPGGGAVPEPSTYGLLGAVALLGAAGWRRLKKRA